MPAQLGMQAQPARNPNLAPHAGVEPSATVPLGLQLPLLLQLLAEI
jgi:hypothetical protein